MALRRQHEHGVGAEGVWHSRQALFQTVVTLLAFAPFFAG